MGEDNKVLEFDQHFRPSGKYRELLKDLAARLDSTSDGFYEIALNLAMNGKWKEWEASKPVGEVLNFSGDMLFGIGDEFVTETIGLRIAMTDLAAKIRARLAHCSADSNGNT